MNHKKQVDKSTYNFDKYMSKGRWCSLWHQLDEILKLSPNEVLEVGPGLGIFKTVANTFEIKVETLDFDPDLHPDYVGSVIAMPFVDCKYDVVCGFQVLEHLPYAEALQAFSEMVRVSRNHIVISLPDSQPVFKYRIQIPKLGLYDLLIPKLQLRKQMHFFDGEHYWEVNKRGYSLKKVIDDFSEKARLLKTYRPFEYPYHRFFVFSRYN
jgi:SAM-dependent methyltransferase